MRSVLITFATEEILLVIFILFMVGRFKSSTVPKMVSSTVFISYCISFSAFIALSADVYNTLSEDNDPLLDGILKNFWFGFYWLSLIFNL
jgi:hypothetical protein